MRTGSQATPSSPLAVAKSAIVVAPAVLLAFGLGLANPDALITRNFETALSAVQPDDRGSTPVAQARVSGSEDFWLSRDHAEAVASGTLKTVSWSAPVAPGDQITVQHGNHPRVYQVMSVEVLDVNDTTRIETGSPEPRQFSVTCRDMAKAEGALVQFTVDGDSRGLKVVAPAGQAL